jgi:hypothetical protein
VKCRFLLIIRNQKLSQASGFTVILIFQTIFGFFLKIFFVHRNGEHNKPDGRFREVFIPIPWIRLDNRREHVFLAFITR